VITSLNEIDDPASDRWILFVHRRRMIRGLEGRQWLLAACT